MLTIIVILSLVLALAVGLLVHHRRESVDLETYGGMKLDHLVGSVFTLAIIPCSFVLAVTYSSFDAAAAEAGRQAGSVQAMFESAAFLQDRASAQHVQEEVICYARAVRDDEWPRLKTRSPASPRVGIWTDSIQATLRLTRDDPATAEIRSADAQRADDRRQVLTRASTGVPGSLIALLIIDCVVAVFFTTAYTVRGMNWRIPVPLVVTQAVVLGATLLVILDLDHPYGGFSDIGPSAIVRTEASMTRDFHTAWPGVQISTCDEHGTPG